MNIVLSKLDKALPQIGICLSPYFLQVKKTKILRESNDTDLNTVEYKLI
ncbi:hypothetical protein Cylst_1804 [Cylindrospermum stagnale PCC 7417]|uniref:Uncharacterized protein n=1 Tax=Cylindrospermum stagnale PCC 7417 TaxID=56107 RepID=K9WV45_9NOST|nr:hypothetical protein Cylst_1804 [Cylindrospermum stagnale PCC 7417]